MNKVYVLIFKDNIEDPYEPGTKKVIGAYSTIELAQWTAQNRITNTTDLFIKLDFTKDPKYTTYAKNKFCVNSYSIEELLINNFNITT